MIHSSSATLAFLALLTDQISVNSWPFTLADGPSFGPADSSFLLFKSAPIFPSLVGLYWTIPLIIALASLSYLPPFPDLFFCLTLVTSWNYSIYLFACSLLAAFTDRKNLEGSVLVSTICPKPRLVYGRVDTQKVAGEWMNHSIWNKVSNLLLS